MRLLRPNHNAGRIQSDFLMRQGVNDIRCCYPDTDHILKQVVNGETGLHFVSDPADTQRNSDENTTSFIWWVTHTRSMLGHFCRLKMWIRL